MILDLDLEKIVKSSTVCMNGSELAGFDRKKHVTSYIKRYYMFHLLIEEINSFVDLDENYTHPATWQGDHSIYRGRIKLEFNYMTLMISLTVNKPVRITSARMSTYECKDVGEFRRDQQRAMEFLDFINGSALTKVNGIIKKLEDV